MKLFVTGGTGFIGSYFLKVALENGHDVVALRRVQREPLFPLQGEIAWLEKSLGDVVESDLAGVDVVVHLAATGVSPKPATWDDCFEVNVVQSLRLAQIARNSGVPRMVVAGTYAEYGKSALTYDAVPSDAALEPTDAYAASKAAQWVALSSFARHQKWELFYGRIFSAYGDGQDEVNFWPQLKKAALAGENFPMTAGEQIRDFVSVERVAHAFLKACLRQDLVSGEPYVCNVAAGKPVMLADFARHYWELWNAQGALQLGAIPYREHEVMKYIPQVHSEDMD